MSLTVGIIGCGKIADQHAAQIQRIPGVELVATCDLEPLMAAQLAERLRAPAYFSDVEEFLSVRRPDVVHITTPPQSHYPLGRRCLEAGCHVYIEKPFTVYAHEAEELIDLARQKGLKSTAGHNLQFALESIEARDLVRSGFLGGPPVHVESYYTYNFGDPSYAKALLGDRNHWVRRLPGKLLHNIISHGIARIAEFMPTDDASVRAFGHTGPLLQEIGADDIIDELRVHIFDGRNMTGNFVFSSQFGPPVNGCRIYGPGNSLWVDNLHRTLVREVNREYKSFLNYFVSPLQSAREQVRNSRRNIWRFVRSRFHDDSGMKALIEAFYRSITEDTPPPIPYREILLTARIMDQIFEQLAVDRSQKPGPAGRYERVAQIQS